MRIFINRTRTSIFFSIYHWLIFTLAVLLVACSGYSDFNNESGPCVHVFKEAVLHIDSVITEGTEDQLTQIKIHTLAINGDPVDVELLLQQTTGIIVDRDVLVCDLPCSFGQQEGSYEFTVTAEGHVNKLLNIDAVYTVFSGGCPSFNDLGTRFDITLNAF